MTTTVGTSGVVRVGSNNVAEVQSFSLTRNADAIEDTAMGDTVRTYKAGLQTATGSVTCSWDRTDTNGQEALTVGASVTLVLWPEGAGTGNDEISMTVIITGVTHNQNINEVIERSFEYQVTGAITDGTQ